MLDETRIDPLPSELLSTGVFALEDGGFIAGDIETDSVDEALRYWSAKSMLFGSMRTLGDLDAAIEQLQATRESERAQCADLAEECVSLRARDKSDVLDKEWQHCTSVLAVDDPRSEQAVSNQIGTAQRRCR